MSKAEMDFPQVNPTEDTERETVEAEQRLQARNTRRLVPVVAAGTLSVLWTIFCLYLLAESNLPAETKSLIDFAGLLAGYATPIAIFWLVALAFQRTDPLLERRLAMAQNLHRAIAPVEAAEQRLAVLNRTLRKELESVDAVADLAADRIGNLENRFQEQISSLFSAAADTEARTASIRDVLERERTAIDGLTVDVEGRFASLETMVQKIADRLEGAGETAANTADHAKERLETSLINISEATENFETRLDTAGQSVSDRATRVQEIAIDVEHRLHASTENAQSSMERFSGNVADLEQRSAELSDHMTTQAATLKVMATEAAIESAKIEETLREHIGEVRSAATDALDRTNEVSSTVSERAQGMTELVLGTVEKAKDLLEEAGQSLEEHCSAALTTSEQVNTKTLETTSATSAAIQEHAEKADRLLMDGLERAKNALESTMSSITDHSDSAVQHAEDTALRTLQHIRQLRAGVEEQLEELARAGNLTSEHLSASADTIADKTTELADKSEKTGIELAAVREQMTLQSDVIAEVLNETRMKLAHLENDLTNQRNVLNAASSEAADRVIEASERFANQSRTIQETAEGIQIDLGAKGGELISIIGQLGTASENSQSQVSEASTDLTEKSSELRAELKESGIALGTAAEAFAGERHIIKEETESVIGELNRASDTMGAEVNKFTEQSLIAANRLDSASQALMDQTERANTDMKKSVDETRVELSGSLEEISNKANERITYMQEEMQATLSRVLTNYQDTADQAEKESALLAMRLGTEADKVADRAEQFISKTSDIEKRIATATKNDFARTSQLLMESMQSSSIDIHKALSDDLPDDVWEDYLAGDKSVFMRRTLKIGDRKTRKAIGEKFKSNTEFRETVARYCRDFEGMMERAMLGDKGNTMSVTLISSDMGKLYLLLGQSTKKFS